MADMSYALLRRDADRSRIENRQAQVYTQVGKVPVWAQSVADESTFLVTFSNPFVEEPLFTCGSSLDPTTPPVSGSWPTCSATVHQWNVATSGPGVIYKAALVGVVTTGVATQKLWIHYSFVGKALSFANGSGPKAGSVVA